MANKTLSEALGEIKTLTADLATANAAIAAHPEALAALTTDRDAAIARADKAEGELKLCTASLETANTSVAELKKTSTTLATENTELKTKEQDLQKRATAIATQTMASVGQHAPVKSSAAPDPANPNASIKPGRGRLQASIEASLAKSKL